VLYKNRIPPKKERTAQRPTVCVMPPRGTAGRDGTLCGKKSEQSGDGALRHARTPSRPVHALLGGFAIGIASLSH
jgi:hypothetical protein